MPSLRLGIRCGVLAFELAALLWPFTAAWAHPLGPPPEVRLEVSGDEVTVRWSAQRDDVYTLARSIGATAQEMIFEEVNGQVVQGGGDFDVALLAQADGLPEYFLEAIQVAQGGDPCEGTLESRPTYDGDPAVLAYRCSEAVGEVTLTITALTEFSTSFHEVVPPV